MVATDVDGRYHLPLSDQDFNNDSLTVVFYSIEYPKLELLLKKEDFTGRRTIIKDVSFEEGPEIIGFEVRGEKAPLHKRIWYGVTRPFRRKR